MSERQGKIVDTISGPKGVSRLIRDGAHLCDLKLEIEVEKSWFREHVRFTVSGGESNLRRCQEGIRTTVACYQAD